MKLSVYGSQESSEEIESKLGSLFQKLSKAGVLVWKSWEPCLPGELTNRAFKKAEDADVFLALLDDDFLNRQSIAGKFYRLLNTKPNTTRFVVVLKKLSTDRLDEYLWSDEPLNDQVIERLEKAVLEHFAL